MGVNNFVLSIMRLAKGTLLSILRRYIIFEKCYIIHIYRMRMNYKNDLCKFEESNPLQMRKDFIKYRFIETRFF